ncbi:MAG: diguanylate cyclase [Magnetococcus sp. THC-1_WYH]
MIRYRFLRQSFLVSLLIAVAIPLYTIFFLLPSLTAQLVNTFEENANSVAHHLSAILREHHLLQDGQIAVSQDFMDEVKKISRDFHVSKHRIFSHTGKIIAASEEKDIGTINKNDYFHQKVAAGQIFTKVIEKDEKTMDGETIKKDVVETYVPMMDNGQFLGAFEIYFDITKQKHNLNRLTFQSSAILISIGFGFFGLLLFVRHSVVRPISAVTDAMVRMAQGDLEQRAPVTGKDEISTMASIFNHMCEQLQESHRGLKREKNKLTTILLGAREGIVATNADGEISLVNPAAQRLLGKSEESIIADGFLQMFDDPDFIKHCLEGAGTGMPDTIVYNNHVLKIYASTIVAPDAGIIGSAALIRDVTDEKKLEEKLRKLSHTDGLTGLLNRRRMDELLTDEINRAIRYHLEFGVLLFDVDHFKQFNDRHGHAQGDRILQGIATAMTGHFRNVDFCCRYGGEEFLVIMPSTIHPGIMEAAERFRIRIEEMTIDGLKVTISIGVAVYPQSGHFKSSEEILKAADAALYEAKSAGRNCVRLPPPTESPMR